MRMELSCLGGIRVVVVLAVAAEADRHGRYF